MAINIGPRIGVEGEAEYRRQINNIIAQTKTLNSDLKAVETTFDENTTAQEKAAAKAKILNQALDAQNQRVSAISEMYEKSKAKLGENDTATLKWKQALNNANIELDKTQKALDEAEKEANDYGEEVEEGTKQNQSFGESISNMMANEKLADFFNKAGDAISKFSDATVNAAKELDVGYDTIVTKTGATGAALDELKASANNIFGSMPVEMADVGAAIGEVNTRFGQTGAELEQTSTAFLQFSQITGRDVADSIDSTDRIMKIFGVDASETENVLGMFAATGQQTGLSVDRLMSTLDTNGATFNELGISIESAAGMLAEFELNGVDTSTVMTAMKKAITNAAKSGKNAGDVLSDTADQIKNAATETEALQIASEVFGTRGAVAMVDGLRSGRISLDETTQSLETYGDVVQDTYEATISPWDKTTQMMNNVKRAGSDLAGTALSALEPAMDKITGVVQKAADGFENLPQGVQTTIGAITGVGMVAGKVVPKVLSFVNTIKGIQTASQVANSVRSLTGATQGADKAQKAFNLTAMANPYVMLTVGIAAAVTALAGLAYAFAEADEGAVSFKESAEGLSTALSQNASASLEQATQTEASIAKMNAQNQIADELVATVEELSQKEHKSASEVEDLRRAVNKLNQIYPDLNLEYSEAADNLNMSNEALREQIALARQNAEVQAYAKIYQQAIEEQFRLEQDQLALQNQINDATGKYGDLITKVSSRGNSSHIFHMDELKTAQSAAEGLNALNDAYDENAAALEHQQELANIARQALEGYGQTVDPVTGAVTDMNGEIVETAEAADEAATAVEGLTDAEEDTGETAGATANEIEEANRKIRESYMSAAQSAHDSVMKQSSLWDELEQKEATSIEAMKKGLQSHIEAYRQYNTNTSLLLNSSEYRTNEAFRNMVNSVVAGGMELAPELAAIAEAFANGDAELAELIDGYGEMDQLAAIFGANTAAAATAAEHGLDAVETAFGKSGIPETAADMADEALTEIDRMITGINGKSTAGYNAGRNLTDSTGKGAQAGGKTISSARTQAQREVDNMILGINGKSIESYAAGKNVTDSAGQGAQAGNKTLENATNEAEGTVDAANKEIDQKKVAARSAGEAVSGGYASGMSSKVGMVTSAAAAVSGAIENEFQKIRSKTYGWGAEMIQQMANGMRSKIPTIKVTAESVAQTVSTPLHHSTPDEGPLKDDDKWGYEFGEQFADSMLRSVPLVANAANQMAYAASLASPAYIDPGMVSGAQPGLSTADIYEAFSAALDEADMKVIIGNREFGRILRDVGVVA